MKKALSLILAGAIIFTMASGCKNSSSADPTQSPSAEAKATEAAKSEEAASTEKAEETNNEERQKTGFPLVTEPLTLKVWGYDSSDIDHETILQVTTLEELTGIHLEFDLFAGGTTEMANEAFNLMVASQNYPDIIAGGFTTDRVNMCIEGNLIVPLNDMIEQYGDNYRQGLKDNPHWEDLLTANDGNIYTFMYTDTGAHIQSQYKLWVYQDWLDQLGLPMPSTTQEYKDMLIAFTENDMNGNGQKDELGLVGFRNDRYSDPLCFLMNPFQLYRHDFHYITDDKKVEFIANTDGWREGIRYLNDLYESGLLLKETYVQDPAQFKSLSDRPKGETIVGSFSLWVNMIVDNTILDWTDYVAVPPLEGPTGLRQTAAAPSGSFGLCTAITTVCKDPVAAFRMFDYLIGEEGNLFNSFGVEGKTYELVDKPSYLGTTPSITTIRTDTRQLLDPSFFPRYDRASVRYGVTEDVSMRNIDNTYVLLTAAQAYEPYYKWHNIPALVWCSDTDVITKRADYQTLFKDFIEAEYTAFIIGTKDIDDDAQWEEYKATLDGMGLQDYINTLEKYYFN